MRLTILRRTLLLQTGRVKTHTANVSRMTVEFYPTPPVIVFTSFNNSLAKSKNQFTIILQIIGIFF